MSSLRYLPWLIAALGFVAGWAAMPVILVPALALLNMFLVYRARLKQLDNTPQRLDRPNLIVEGGFLFFQQALIIAMLYLLGFLIHHHVPLTV